MVEKLVSRYAARLIIILTRPYTCFLCHSGRYNEREMSVSIPFLKRPSKLDGTHAGDVGFDPLGLSEKLDLYTMMEAETRHARLAMLAVVGWPLSELFGPNFMLHGPNHLAPSVLNGFDPLSFITVAGILGGLDTSNTNLLFVVLMTSHLESSTRKTWQTSGSMGFPEITTLTLLTCTVCLEILLTDAKQCAS